MVSELRSFLLSKWLLILSEKRDKLYTFNYFSNLQIYQTILANEGDKLPVSIENSGYLSRPEIMKIKNII